MARPCLRGCGFGPGGQALRVFPSSFCNMKGHWRDPSGNANTRFLWLLGRELEMVFVSVDSGSGWRRGEETLREAEWTEVAKILTKIFLETLECQLQINPRFGER